MGAHHEEIRAALVTGARSLLRAARPLERTYLLCCWALSPDTNLRRVAATVLGGSDDVGSLSILRRLRNDPAPEVRAEARAAEAGGGP